MQKKLNKYKNSQLPQEGDLEYAYILMKNLKGICWQTQAMPNSSTLNYRKFFWYFGEGSSVWSWKESAVCYFIINSILEVSDSKVELVDVIFGEVEYAKECEKSD